MFRILGIIALIVGFTVPYVSHESVVMWQMILIQLVFYAIGFYYLKDRYLNDKSD